MKYSDRPDKALPGVVVRVGDRVRALGRAFRVRLDCHLYLKTWSKVWNWSRRCSWKCCSWWCWWRWRWPLWWWWWWCWDRPQARCAEGWLGKRQWSPSLKNWGWRIYLTSFPSSWIHAISFLPYTCALWPVKSASTGARTFKRTKSSNFLSHSQFKCEFSPKRNKIVSDN